MKRLSTLMFAIALALSVSCSSGNKTEVKSQPKATPPPPSYFKPDPATVGSLSGSIHFTGRPPARKLIDMSDDPACVEAHHGKAYDESVMVNPNHTLANVFVYVKSGLEGKEFAVPSEAVTIDQRGCWFHPRVIGIQTGQILKVINSDPVTHNIHPQASVNREWNHSQGQGDPPIERKFTHAEVMIPVKCNIHSWMHAYIGVVDNPYFAVSGSDGTFTIPNLPPGDYVIEAWQEKLGTQEQKVTVPPSAKATVNFSFKGH